MMDLDHILAKLKDAYAARFEPGGVRLLAEIYWPAVLFVAAVAVGCALAWGGWDLANVMQQFNAPPPTGLPPASTLDLGALQSAARAVQDRQTQYQTLQANPAPAVPDPRVL